MKSFSTRPLPLALALALSFGVAVAQAGSGTTGSGSSMTGGGAAPAAQPGTGTRNAESKKDDQLARADRKFIQDAAASGVFEVEAAQLGSSKATDFDRDFVREVGIKAHEKDIKTFQKASEQVKDPQLKAWVDKTLPTLREHLAQAQKMPQGGAAAMGNRGAPGGTGGGTGANKTGS